MDPFDRNLLEKTAKLAEENHQMLKQMRRWMRFSRLFSALYWIMILAVALGAFYYIQPYVNSLTEIYSSASETYSGLFQQKAE